MSPFLTSEAPRLPVPPTQQGGPTRIGLHATAEELVVWQDRAANGPYKIDEDVSTNSPGDWTRITSDAADFLANPSAERQNGQTNDRCTNTDLDINLFGQGTPGTKMLNAGFYYLVTGDTDYRDAVRTELLTQAAVAGVDFSNTTRWCVNEEQDTSPHWNIGNWITRLLYAYDYIRPTLTEGDQTTLDTWFLNYATYAKSAIDYIICLEGQYGGYAFPYAERYAENYSNPTDAGVGSSQKDVYDGGATRDNWTEWHWNNRSAMIVRAFTLIGIMQNNTTLIDAGKLFFKEWLRFSVFPDNTPSEFGRWLDTNPCLGWSYASYIIGSMCTIADALGRTGDYSMFDYSTSAGYNGSAGGTKSLHNVIVEFCKYVNHDNSRYIPGHANEANYLIDSIDDISGENRAEDTAVVMANLYYEDAYVKSIYTRAATGAPDYPATPSTSWATGWSGECGTLPGILFMFGQNEGVVDPYP